MKKLLLIAAAAAVVGLAAPASAQVNIRAGDHGVKVRVGHGHDHHRAHRHHYRHHYARGNCRTMQSRTVTPSGRVIVKTRRVCR
jgi:hypothetical protein